MEKTKHTSIRIRPEDWGLFPPGLGATGAVREIIERYRDLVATESARVQRMFSSIEWDVMRRACKGVQFRAGAIRGAVLSAVYDAAIGTKDVQAALECKLAALTPVQSYALVHILETEAAQ